MTSFVLLAALLAFSFVKGEPRTMLNSNLKLGWTGFGLSGRIVNGTKAALGQFPYQVSLRRSYSAEHFCGGSLIDNYYVLTAAHCMYLYQEQILPWTITVVGGELSLNRPSSTGQKRGVKAIYVHPDYNFHTLQNDIAVLALKAPFTIAMGVNIAPLATSATVPGTICQVSGWGYTAENIHSVSNDLLYVDMPLLSEKKCKQLLENLSDVPPGMMCAGYIEGQRDACQGDSGGGLICNGVLTGVVSGGFGCARPGIPGVYTNVCYFNEWIQETMRLRGILKRDCSSADKLNIPSLFVFLAGSLLAFIFTY